MQKILLLFVLLASLLYADEAEDIIKKLDDNMRGKSIYLDLTMRVEKMGHTRKITLKNWAEGTKKSFVKITYPPRDKGITFLSLNGQMWQYIPKIERTIKIPPSMMLQSWMGSDITNDDMVKQSSLVDDYTPKLLDKNSTTATIELTPKENAAVVWGKIVLEIDLSTYTSKKDTYYDEDNKVVRYFIYKNVKKIDGYFLPMIWKVIPADKDGSKTEIIINDVKYNQKISSAYFSKSALKRFSR